VKLTTQLLLATALTAVSTGAAHAQESEVDQLKAEIEALKAAIQALSDKVEQQSTKSEEVENKVEAAKIAADNAQESVNTVAAAQASASPIDVEWKGAPKIKGEGGWSFKPRGRVQVDVATVDAPSGVSDPGLGFSNELRRVRLGAEGTVPGGFGYKVYGDIASGGFTLNDAFFYYKKNGLKLSFGHLNNFQGLEELTSSNDTSFIERAGFTDAFNFERRVGIAAEYTTSNILLQGGVFTDNNEDLNDDGNNAIGLDGRFVYFPKIGDTQLHFGGSAHWRDLGDAITEVDFRQRPLVHPTDIRFIDTDDISDSEEETNFALEAAVVSGRFHAQAEASWHTVTRSAGFENPTFFGGAIEAGFYLTNDTRTYKNGVFKGIKVKNPVGQGGWGALQFNVRYDRLDLTDADIIGGTQDSLQASLIWNPVNHVRFLINYGYLDYTDVIPSLANGTETDFSVNVVGARAQINF